MPTAGRRTLCFATLDQVMPDVDRLLREGCTTVGKWSLGQVCNHLTSAFTSSVDGFAYQAPWPVRAVARRFILPRMLAGGRMSEGLKIPGGAPPKPGLDDRAEVEALRGALRAFAAHAGPLAPHPYFGVLTRDQADRLHCIHCAHHLSFATPAAADAPSAPAAHPL